MNSAKSESRVQAVSSCQVLGSPGVDLEKSFGAQRPFHSLCSGSLEAAPYTLSPPEPDHATHAAQ